MRTASQLAWFGTGPLELVWTLDVPAPLERAWAVFADTHTMNRRVGLQIRYEQQHEESGEPHRYGWMQAFGKDVPFEERIFDYQAPHRVYIQREFEEGPVNTYTLGIQLRELSSGRTSIEYRVAWYPRSVATRLLVRAVFPAVYGPPVSRALTAIESGLQKERFEEGQPPRLDLKAEAPETIKDLVQMMDDKEVGEQFARLLLEEDDDAVGRIQLRPLAREWGLPIERVIDSAAQAVRLGLLDLRWELLCPSCFGASVQSIQLDPSGMEGHCPSCNIAVGGNLADSISVVFRAPEHLRQLNDAVLCVGSPSWTPHLLARSEIPAYEERTWQLQLPQGAYRVRRLGSLEGCHIEARPGAESSELVINLDEETSAPNRAVLAPGEVTIHVRSRRPVLTRIVLEDRWSPRDALTASQLLERSSARALLPEALLPSDLNCVVKSTAVLATEVLAERESQSVALSALLNHLRPSSLIETEQALISLWPDIDSALDAASRMEGAWQFFNSVSHGAILEVQTEGTNHPAGLALEDAGDGLRSALPGRAILSEKARSHPGLSSLLEGASPRLRLEEGPRFDDRQDFLVEFLTPQPSPSIAALDQDPPTIDDLDGQPFAGRYQLGRTLGEGGFGVVYSAQDRHQEQNVVIKLLRPKFFEGSDQLALFLREARALSMIDDPAVVRFSDFGHDEAGRIFVAMERLSGQDLAQLLIAEKRLSPSRAVSIADGMLRGLTATHNSGLLHRDIKPSNIFLAQTPDGSEVVKLIDFGIAVDRSEAIDFTGEGKVIGTLPYMAKEQIRALPMGPPADLFAVGVVLWKMLTGVLPMPELPAIAAVGRRLHSGTPPIRECHDDVPVKLAQVIDQALATEADDRFPDAEAMRAALQAAIQA